MSTYENRYVLILIEQIRNISSLKNKPVPQMIHLSHGNDSQHNTEFNGNPFPNIMVIISKAHQENCPYSDRYGTRIKELV